MTKSLTMMLDDGKWIILNDWNVARVALSELDGRTFQVHRISDTQLKLYPVEINDPACNRCPVIINGERCAGSFGHLGQHCWNHPDED